MGVFTSVCPRGATCCSRRKVSDVILTCSVLRVESDGQGEVGFCVVDDEDTSLITIVIDQVIPVGSAVKGKVSSSTSLKW